MDKLSKEIGISRSVISEYESGDTDPSLGVAMKIVRYFGLTLTVITDKDLSIGMSVLKEPSVEYGIDEVERLRIQNETLLSVIREFGRGQAEQISDVDKSQNS